MEEKTEREIKAMLAKHGITMTQLSEWFGYKNLKAFASSSARQRILTGILKFYEKVKNE